MANTDGMPTRAQVRRAKELAGGYREAKVRAAAYPRMRPTFMAQMKVSLDEYREKGLVKYDGELLNRIHPDDQAFFNRYLEDLENVWIVESAISAIRNEKTREVAGDIILSGMTPGEAGKKHGMAGRTVRYHHLKAIKTIASILPG